MKRKNKTIRTSTRPQIKASTASARYAVIDIMRGLAICAMILYHFCFDLNQFGLLHLSMSTSPFWLITRTVIVTSFLLLVGFSFVLAQNQSFKAYTLRIIKIAICAIAVTCVSIWMFPKSYIFFGILHFIAFISLFSKLFLKSYYLNLALGLGFLLLGTFFSHPLFNQDSLQWIGLMTFKPYTEDYVPLLPWLGVIMLGVFFGQYAKNQTWFKKLVNHQPKNIDALLAWMGKKSLLIYMLHQPILMSILWLYFTQVAPKF